MKKMIIVFSTLFVCINVAFPSFGGEIVPSRYGTGMVYRNDDGTICEKEWKFVDGDWYYFGFNGDMCKNSWQGAYYLGPEGKMLKDVVTPDGYRLDVTGKWDGKLKALSPAVESEIRNAVHQESSSSFLKEQLKTGEVVYYKRVERDEDRHSKISLTFEDTEKIWFKDELYKNQKERFEGGRIFGRVYNMDSCATYFDDEDNTFYVGNGKEEYIITCFGDSIYLKQIKGNKDEAINGVYVFQKGQDDHFKKQN